jgi:hypothetical protein
MAQITDKSRFAGTDDLKTSVGGEELISIEKAENAPNGTIFYAKVFRFYNEDAVKVQINGSNTIYIPAGVGFDSDDYTYANITSFKIINAEVKYCCFFEY